MSRREAVISTLIVAALAGCASSSTDEPTAEVQPRIVRDEPYFVHGSPMPYGVEGESIHVLETSASEANGIYRQPGSRPYIIVTQTREVIEHVQRPWAIYFDFNSSKIDGTQIGAIQDMVAYLNNNSSRHVSIAGFTDAYGKKERNDDLAMQRASSVRTALLKHGLTNGKQVVRLEGAPQSHYLVANADKSLAARNRRVEVILLE